MPPGTLAVGSPRVEYLGIRSEIIDELGGGFKYFLFSPLFGEDSHFDEHIFQMGGSTTNQ